MIYACQRQLRPPYTPTPYVPTTLSIRINIDMTTAATIATPVLCGLRAVCQFNYERRHLEQFLAARN